MTPEESLPDEQWRPIPGWEGRYEVSNLGRVFSVQRHGVSRSGRFMVLSPMPRGHLTVGLRGGRGTKTHRQGVHLLVMAAFVGPLPEGMETRHLDGDPTNNRLDNLRYGTRSENHLDRAVHRDPAGRFPHCKNGHPYTPENTYRAPSRPNYRICRICQRVRDLRYRAVA